MKLIDGDALKEAVSNSPLIDFTDDDIFELIDNAPTVEPRIEYGADGQPYRLFMSGGQVVPDMLQGWRYEERPQGDLNNAIKTIKAVCKEYNTCVECPMNRNCNEHPATWTEAEGGAENE